MRGKVGKSELTPLNGLLNCYEISTTWTRRWSRRRHAGRPTSLRADWSHVRQNVTAVTTEFYVYEHKGDREGVQLSTGNHCKGVAARLGVEEHPCLLRNLALCQFIRGWRDDVGQLEAAARPLDDLFFRCFICHVVCWVGIWDFSFALSGGLECGATRNCHKESFTRHLVGDQAELANWPADLMMTSWRQRWTEMSEWPTPFSIPSNLYP